DLELQSWMRVAAKDYANAIHLQLRHDLVDGARILSTFRAVYRPIVTASKDPPRCNPHSDNTASHASGKNCDKFSTNGPPPLFGYSKQRPLAACMTIEPRAGDGCDDVRLLPPGETPVESRWSPIRSIVAFNVDGDRFGPALSPFRDMHTSPQAHIPD